MEASFSESKLCLQIAKTIKFETSFSTWATTQSQSFVLESNLRLRNWSSFSVIKASILETKQFFVYLFIYLFIYFI